MVPFYYCKKAEIHDKKQERVVPAVVTIGAMDSLMLIVPRDYSRMLEAIARCEQQGMDREQAELEAFYAVTGGGK